MTFFSLSSLRGSFGCGMSRCEDGKPDCALGSVRSYIVEPRGQFNAVRHWLTPQAYATFLQTPSSQRDRPLPLAMGSASCPVASAIETQFARTSSLFSLPARR